MLGHPNAFFQVGAFVRRNGLRAGSKTALVCGTARLTWRQVDQATDRLAALFRDQGIGRKTHVAILGSNDHIYVLVQFALFKLGATCVLLNAELAARSLATQLAHAEATAVVTGRGIQATVNGIRDELGPCRYFTWDPEDNSEGVINLDAAIRDTTIPDPFPIAAVDPEDIAALIFSSGTTGTPKGAVNPYWTLLAKTICLTLHQEFRPSDICLILTPMCMGGTQLMAMMPSVMLGMTMVILSPFDPAQALALIEAERTTTGFMVPTITNALVRHPDFQTRDLSSLRSIVSGGAAVPMEVFRRLDERGIGLFDCYGTSEAGGGVMLSAEEKKLYPNSVGRAMTGFELRIVEPDSLRPVPTGELGEIVLQGDMIAKGYWKQPAINAETFAEGWFRTGDIGRVDENGLLYLADRKKDMVKSGGMNVYPKDVEDALYDLEGVVECAVAGLPHPYWGEAVAAFVVKRPDAGLDQAAVTRALKQALSAYQVPKAVIFLDALPKTTFGKFDKVALRQTYAGFFADSAAK